MSSLSRATNCSFNITLRKMQEVLMMTYTHITVERSFQDKVATITMRRLEVHNAFNWQLIQDLQAAFTELVPDQLLYAVVLTDDVQSFSAVAVMIMRNE